MPVMTHPNHQQSGSSTTMKNPDDLFAIFDSPSSEPSLDTASAESSTSAKHHHKKTRSLVGFDPLLDTMEQSKPPSEGAVWSDHDSSKHHPLLSSPSSKSGSTPSSKSAAHRTSKSACVGDLHDIASQLSIDKPRALSSEEERRITLGDTANDSISKHDRKLLKKKSHHRNTQSFSDVIGLRPKQTPPATPETRGKALVKQQQQSSPTNTPPRSHASTAAHSPKSIRNALSSKLSPTRTKSSISKEAISIPTLAKQSPTSFLKHATSMVDRSSEVDPSPHQVSIPSPFSLLRDAKLCALLDSYRKLDQNFDWNVLKNVDTLTLKEFVLTKDASSNSIAGLTTQHKPIVQALLDCGDDIQVEGFFSSGDNDDKLQVGVFSQQNTFIIVYRGTNDQQAKPIARGKMTPIELDPQNPTVLVYPPFRQAYFALEPQVYKLLDTLMDENPFSDIVFTGSSFGAALATIGAVRFASARPMLRFACHAFGSPKVGTLEWRQVANSLSNLKIFRVEYANDANCHSPSDAKWQHVGHALAIHASVGTNNKTPSHGAVVVYKFDQKKPPVNRLQAIRKPNVKAYVRAMEPFASKELEWTSLFVGQDGNGVRGNNNEKRLMV